ncbi:hypothetical protein [Hymenobacter rigui]|uniref:Uncharacterized protein n=1 Tax=Hymenobacter rigui TaxID=334424 RepID=A0A428KC14_9BACT|nr:hypothetical protein [Hymenobacter rigui]RSK43882.1 hypothetical protein EI291_21265 [Hymenobacter rigui]
MNIRKLFLSAGILLSIAKSSVAQELQKSFAGSLVILHSGDTLRGPLTYLPRQDIIILTMLDQTRRTFSPMALRAFVVNGEISPEMLRLIEASAPTAVHIEAGKVPVIDPRSSLLPSLLHHDKNRVFISHRWPASQMQRYRSKAGFFEVLVSGNAMLLQRQVDAVPAQPLRTIYRRPTTEFVKTNLNSNVPTTTTDTFVRLAGGATGRELKSRLYVSMPNGELHFLQNPRKDLLNCFPLYKREVLSFAHQHHIIWSAPQDIAQVIGYINALAVHANG